MIWKWIESFSVFLHLCFVCVALAGDESSPQDRGRLPMTMWGIARRRLQSHEIKVIRRFIFIKARNASSMTEIFKRRASHTSRTNKLEIFILSRKNLKMSLKHSCLLAQRNVRRDECNTLSAALPIKRLEIFSLKTSPLQCFSLILSRENNKFTWSSRRAADGTRKKAFVGYL